VVVYERCTQGKKIKHKKKNEKKENQRENLEWKRGKKN